MPNAIQTDLEIAPYKCGRIFDVLPLEIIYEVFSEDILCPIDRLSFALISRQALETTKSWHREDVRHDNMTGGLFSSRSSYDDPIGYHVTDTFQHLSLYERIRSRMAWQRPLSGPRGYADIYRTLGYSRHNSQALEGQNYLINFSDQALPPPHREFSILATTFLKDPWLFLYPGCQRTCIACPELLEHSPTSITLQERLNLQTADIIRTFFVCSEYPQCYYPDLTIRQHTFVQKQREGYMPWSDIQFCRLYWQCQKLVRRLSQGHA